MNIADFMIYPARFEKEADGGFSVFVRVKGDEWATQGNTEEEAKAMALSVIIDSAGFMAGKELIPTADQAQEGDVMISLPIDVALKFMLRNAMLEERWRIADIARKINCTPQRLANILDFSRSSKLGHLAEVFEAIGRPLKIEC